MRECMNINFPNLLILDLGRQCIYEENNPIGNEGVSHLKQLNNMSIKLNIKDTNITDRILETIFALKFSELKLSRYEEM